MSTKKNSDNETSLEFIGFVPHKLEVEGRPELNDLPFNILFGSYGTKDGVPVFGTALYEPNFATAEASTDLVRMEYRNAFGGNHWVMVEYNRAEKSYRGEKFVDGKSIGMAFGAAWQMFFVHLTMLGLSTGERCWFDQIKK